MRDEEKAATELAFAMQVLGIDSVSDGPADPDSRLGRIQAAERELIAQGLTGSALEEALMVAYATELLTPDGPIPPP